MNSSFPPGVSAGFLPLPDGTKAKAGSWEMLAPPGSLEISLTVPVAISLS